MPVTVRLTDDAARLGDRVAPVLEAQVAGSPLRWADYRSEDVEGHPEATGRDHLDPGGSSRATGIKPVD